MYHIQKETEFDAIAISYPRTVKNKIPINKIGISKYSYFL